MIHLSTTSKLMCVGIALSLGWILLEACECEDTKEDQYPGFWVTCIGNQPALMTYNGNSPSVVTQDSGGRFNPSDYDCTHPNSPSYKGSMASAPFMISGPGGPRARQPHDATGSGTAYIPQRLRDLPFTPDVPPPGSPPVCDSTYPDVLQTDHNESLVTRISTCPFAIKAKIPVVSRPLQIQITPDGSTALVTSFDNAVNFIDLGSNKVIQTLTTDLSVNPNGLAISPDGTTAYVTSFNVENPVILVINIASKTIVATIPTISYAQGATLTPDGSQLWITSPLANEVDVLDTLTNTLTYRLNIGTSTDVAFNATGTTAYLTSGAHSVVAINTATFQTINTYTVGQGPADITMGYGDQFLVVNNSIDNSVSVIDLLKKSVATTAVAGTPSGIAFVH